MKEGRESSVSNAVYVVYLNSSMSAYEAYRG